jgi:5-methylcytosine-specific restriction endonuclease McrA
MPALGRCGFCGDELGGKKARWCGKTCEYAWRNNHEWPRARRAARTRDKQTCSRCGTKRPRKPNRKHFKSDNAFEVAVAAYEAVKLEVNHIVPLDGAKRAAAFCSHHLDNLETLCAGCHAVVTADQAATRAAARREAKVAAALAGAMPVLVPLEGDGGAAEDPKAIKTHLGTARRALAPALRPFFVGATFDVDAKRLVGRDGLTLQWLRPDDPANTVAVVVTRTAGAA